MRETKAGLGIQMLLERNPITVRFVIFVFFPILLLIVSLFFYLRSSLPPASGIFYVPNLDFPVVITHDKYGIPDILAKTDHDAYFALGFKHANDRLWQLEMQRRLARGSLSEILGAKAIQQDVWMRTLGLYSAAEKSIPYLNPDTVSALNAYADGINFWITRAPVLPIEFQIFRFRPDPWTVSDSLSLQKIFALTLEGNMYDELRRSLLRRHMTPEQVQYFYPHDPLTVPKEKADHTDQNPIAIDLMGKADLLLTYGMGHSFAGSNAWVISGRYTHSGYPILANDPHLGLQLPSIWYAAAMSGEKLHVSGMTLVGLPMVILGQNANIAWGGTSLMSDQQDLFVETVSPDHPNAYRNGDQWKAFEIRNETIKIASEFPSWLHETIKPIEIMVRKSDRGPIVSDSELAADMVLSLRWAALDDEDRTIDSFFEIQYAKNWEEFRKALTKLKAPGMNFLYADRAGNIGHQVAGMIPKRKNGIGIVPTDALSVSNWDGYEDFEDLPSIYNPSEGFIVNANNKVHVSSEIIISHEWAPPSRHDRIVGLINEYINKGDLLTSSDMRTIQSDDADLSALAILPYLRSTDANSIQEIDALKVLEHWDGEFSEESVGASIFATWIYYLRREIFESVLTASWQRSSESRLLSSSIERIDWSQLAKILSTNAHGWCQASSDEPCAMERKKSLQKAIKHLAKLTGSQSVSKWKWFKVSKTEFVHQPFGSIKGLELIFKKEVHSVTSPNSINASNLQFDEFEGFTQNFGSGFRQILDLEKIESQWYMLSTGQSGNPMSRNFSDMIQPFSKNMLINRNYTQTSSRFIKLIPGSEANP